MARPTLQPRPLPTGIPNPYEIEPAPRTQVKVAAPAAPSTGALRAGGAPATQADFLGEGGVAPTPMAPRDPNDEPNPNNPGGISNNQLAKMQRAERERLAGVPYGTPQSQGGTATPWRVETSQQGPLFGNAPTVKATAIGPDGRPLGPTSTSIDYSAVNLNPAVAAVTGGYVPRNGQPGALERGVDTRGAFYQPPLHLDEPGKYVPPPGGFPALPGEAGYGQSPLGSGGGTGGPGYGALRGEFEQDVMREKARGTGSAGPAPRVDMSNADVKAFLDEERARKGPSEAEALLMKATNQNQAAAIGAASGARGGAGSRDRAMRQAVSANVAAGAQSSQDVAALRAREDQVRRQRILDILGLEATGAARGDTLGATYEDLASRYGLAGMESGDRAADRGSRERVAKEGFTSAERIAEAGRDLSREQTALGIREARRQEPTFLEGVAANPLVNAVAGRGINDLYSSLFGDEEDELPYRRNPYGY